LLLVHGAVMDEMIELELSLLWRVAVTTWSNRKRLQII
jgi:hypothetical protein